MLGVRSAAVILVIYLLVANAKPPQPPKGALFFENFQDDDWQSRWKVTTDEKYQGDTSIGAITLTQYQGNGT